MHLKPYCTDNDDWPMQLVNGMFYSDCHFGEEVKITEIKSKVSDDKIRHWDDIDQHSLHREAISWLGYQGFHMDNFLSHADEHSERN